MQKRFGAEETFPTYHHPLAFRRTLTGCAISSTRRSQCERKGRRTTEWGEAFMQRCRDRCRCRFAPVLTAFADGVGSLGMRSRMCRLAFALTVRVEPVCCRERMCMRRMDCRTCGATLSVSLDWTGSSRVCQTTPLTRCHPPVSVDGSNQGKWYSSAAAVGCAEATVV